MKFYKLSEADLPLIFSLSESEIKVWCWLSVHLPFDNSRALEIDTSQLAEEIGISRRSVQRALKTIQENEVFEVEFTKAKVKRKAQSAVLTASAVRVVSPIGEEQLCKRTSQMSPSVTDVAEASQMSPKRHRCRRSVTDVAEASQMSSTQAETHTVQAFENSKINKTYSDFKDSLSEQEREDFLKFGEQKAAQLKNPPIQLPRKWIKENWEELADQWFQTRDEKNQKYNFAAYSEPQHQMWYGQLQALVCGATQSGDSPRLEQFLKDDFYSSWLNWAKTARKDVREFLASNPIPT
ncbi:helix-turn-helix domain-containing protein [Nostoc sp. CHAB 5784]|uniref:helix-turn-helix domain-containing protein n=1 Tax=Nostoc mirabile TaxID=2907820 RepID=UPI001E5C790B|nr:helix-turn-helix domain-containing protein [Nostoc mirabile]MCC5667820.1 helix-turn-helix domain-containing protein [Nostoc mirabile CHAB5784]